jgi:glutamate-ammonia-ligase adenylyltransferase
VETLSREVIRRLDAGDSVAELLAEVGEPDPAKADAALCRAAQHPDLQPARTLWIPALLTTARPGAGAQRLEELALRYRQTAQRGLDPASYPGLPLVLGSSDFLGRLLLRHAAWLEELRGEPPAAPADEPIAPDWTSIRIAKYKGLLRVAARDLLGRPFAESPGELASLADRCLVAALECAAEDVETEPLALLALGKLGGRELNFSSDVDLVFLYATDQAPQDLTQNQQAARVIQTFKKHLEAPSEDGFGFRVDLDLRPEGRQGPLANSVAAALHYYESFGREWERQMLIRARPVPESSEIGLAFCREIQPYVYRTLIDPGAIEAVREMKVRIETERRGEGRDLEFDLKDGRGGIRDVEFLVQAVQLFHGGRVRPLRTGNVFEALRVADMERLLPEGVARALGDAYAWLRRAEHAVQMVEERQVHRVPRDRAAQLGLARRMGYADERAGAALNRFLDDWTFVRAEVRRHFDDLVLETDDG